MNPATILIGLIAVAVGAGIGYALRREVAKHQVATAEAKIEKMLADAKAKATEHLIQAKEKAISIGEEAKRDEQARRTELSDTQKRLEKREALFDTKLLELQDKQNQLKDKMTAVEDLRAKVDGLRQEQVTRLEHVAGMTRDAAKQELMAAVELHAKEDLLTRIRKLEETATDDVESRARTILGTAIQRIASSHSVETTTSNVDLPNDEMKGRIIGKEGRNIKAIEQLTGTEIIVDDTPQMITVSGFSPIRRQIARRAIEKLIADGRIHPARIEECVEEAKKELAVDIKKSGEEALVQMGLGVAGYDPKLIQILGRLKYRTSYGQNVLTHSMEVGNLAALIAAELGADVPTAKKGGLFHDIGKAVDHDIQGSHPELGYNLMLKFGLPEEVAYMSIAHHEDKPRTLEGVIVKAADAISGARRGARKDSLEQYVQRLTELEGTATSFPGVEKAYAIQAGRELRVFIDPKQMDDLAAYQLAREVAAKIESELKYPGEIRVTVIRETRVIEYAR